MYAPSHLSLTRCLQIILERQLTHSEDILRTERVVIMKDWFPVCTKKHNLEVRSSPTYLTLLTRRIHSYRKTAAYITYIDTCMINRNVERLDPSYGICLVLVDQGAPTLWLYLKPWRNINYSCRTSTSKGWELDHLNCSDSGIKWLGVQGRLRKDGRLLI